MFLEAEEQKLMQTLHSLIDAMAVHEVVWGFKNNLWLIILWPYRCSLRFPVRLFVRYPDILLVYKVGQFVIYFYMYTCLSCSLLLKVALKMSGGAVRSSAVNHSLWACTERSEQGRVKDTSSCDPSFISLSSAKYIAFWGRKDINRKIAGL